MCTIVGSRHDEEKKQKHIKVAIRLLASLSLSPFDKSSHHRTNLVLDTIPQSITNMYSPSFVVRLSLLLSPAALAAAGGWCTFWSDDECTHRSGHVDYDVANTNIFQNGGPYFSCRESQEYILVSYPPGDSAGDRPNHCHVFIDGPGCTRLPDLGYTTGDGGYYRLKHDFACPAISSKRDQESGNETFIDRSDTDTTRRDTQDANYVIFYDDPAGNHQSGSVHYSTHNQGCFENGGAYMGFAGDDSGWSLQQWSGIDNFKCADTMWNCRHAQDFSFGEGGIRHLDDYGFHTGFGSYKIVRGGCP
jgi:hypothetical protein